MQNCIFSDELLEFNIYEKLTQVIGCKNREIQYLLSTKNGSKSNSLSKSSPRDFVEVHFESVSLGSLAQLALLQYFK